MTTRAEGPWTPERLHASAVKLADAVRGLVEKIVRAEAEVARLKEALTWLTPHPLCLEEPEVVAHCKSKLCLKVRAALSPAPVQKCQWSEHGKTCDRPATRIDLARGDPPHTCDEHAGALHQPLSPAPSEPKEKHDSLCVPNSEFGCDCYAPSESERSGR